jgi:ATP-dependent Clp protease ATP-binding subunit ClpA
MKVQLKNNLNQNLKSKTFGQDHIIDELTNVLNVNSCGLGDENKPIGSFLFIGPTGVGKTELAIQLAKELKMNFKRFDMSEYSEKYSIKNFIGGDAGLVGYEDGGLLTNYVYDYPQSVILFDEIEKAHKNVMDIFLQILDYGHLTSTKGEEVFFQSCIIIFTSNLGENYQLRRTMGFFPNIIVEEDYDDELNSFLKPEFKGRLDCLLNFNSLDKNMISNIIDKNTNELVSSLKKLNVSIKLSSSLKELIINRLLVENLGARSVAKIFREKIKTKIAKEIINENIPFGSKLTFSMDEDSDNFILSVNYQSTINDLTITSSLMNENWFSDAFTAQEYAKSDPTIIITRSPDGNGYISKK